MFNIPSLHIPLRLPWPAAGQKPGAPEISAAKITFPWARSQADPPLERQIACLGMLDAPMADISVHEGPPSPFQCTLRAPLHEVDKVRGLLPEVMPVLSQRQHITVY